ncbi:K02A2.6-like [Cordylochernes scorpioides]|uniref:K02A2.6-like n=1 Tax=Cordylochernes scorpioides TaxID=51811 RepID=A0ABY6LL39_9ARAC|nr:K02A2.6-like [Cordylochernes scorpioides]
MWSLQKLRPYIFGRKSMIITWLASISDPCSRLARWGLELKKYDFEIVPQMHYRLGILHEAAEVERSQNGGHEGRREIASNLVLSGPSENIHCNLTNCQHPDQRPFFVPLWIPRVSSGKLVSL